MKKICYLVVLFSFVLTVSSFGQTESLDSKSYFEAIKNLSVLKAKGEISNDEFQKRKAELVKVNLERSEDKRKQAKAAEEASRTQEIAEATKPSGRHIFIGMSKKQVIEALGTPEYDGGNYFKYGLHEIIRFDSLGFISSVDGFSYPIVHEPSKNEKTAALAAQKKEEKAQEKAAKAAAVKWERERPEREAREKLEAEVAERERKERRPTKPSSCENLEEVWSMPSKFLNREIKIWVKVVSISESSERSNNPDFQKYFVAVADPETGHIMNPVQLPLRCIKCYAEDLFKQKDDYLVTLTGRVEKERFGSIFAINGKQWNY